MVVPCLFVTIFAVATPRSASPYQKLAIFARVLSHLERLYIEPINGEDLVFGAIRGMMRTLDPHSAFLMPEDFELLEADTKGKFGGIGVEVGVREDLPTVIVPIAGSPAEKSGILPGDQIIAIEGRPTLSMSLEDVVRVMRGEPGSKVTITIRRATKRRPFDVVLIREIIRVDSVETDLIVAGYPWIRVRAFQDGTTAEVAETLERMKRIGGPIKGILLDLRRNPGGLLNEAVRLSDLFIDRGILVTTRGRDGKIIQSFKANRRGTIATTPMVVLIDGACASAAEIVSGALQDHGRALLVGTRSFGKGSVQSIIDLGQGYGLKLTIARYFTPAGRSIQVEGVIPDVIVASRNAPEPDEQTAAIRKMPGEGDLHGHLDAAKTKEPPLTDIEIDDYQLRIGFQLLGGLVRSAEVKGLLNL